MTASSKYGILAAVDGSSESDAALQWAIAEAALLDTPITLIHVIAPVVVTWPVRNLHGSYNRWQEDNAAHRGGFSRMLLGSVSTAVAEGSTTPVIVVRS